MADDVVLAFGFDGRPPLDRARVRRRTGDSRGRDAGRGHRGLRRHGQRDRQPVLPAVVRVEPGDTVEWTMGGQTAHTVRADDGSWDSGALEPGDE